MKSLPRNRENIRFTTPVQKEMHKVVSSIAMGETFVYEIRDNLTKEQQEELLYAIKLSAYYNNMELFVKWSKNKKKIHIISEI
jgi:hypothetical protein